MTGAMLDAWQAPPGDDPGADWYDVDAPPAAPALTFATIAELRTRVAAAGPRRWLIRGLWPSGAYGVHAAEMKAQKTWTALDLAVSVATGTPWLDEYPIDDPGPALVFAGEGGEAGVLRRVDAITASRGIEPDALQLIVCGRAPHLGSPDHLALFAAALERYTPRLVVLDPLYLAARGAQLGDLYAMGALLEKAQHLCDDARASLLVVHHYNRSRDLKTGAARMSGAGPAEWGRVLIGAKVLASSLDPATQETTVLTELDAIGGEIPGATFRVRRRIRAEDPTDLESPLRYAVEVVPADTQPGHGDGTSALPPATRKLYEALTAVATATEPATIPQLVDHVAKVHGHGLKRETASRSLHDLAARGLVDSLTQGPGQPSFWWPTEEANSEA